LTNLIHGHSFVAAALQTHRDLPVEPFGHADPTAVALLDLDVSLIPTPLAGEPDAARFRDALIVVRLHGQPLGMLYVDHRLDELGRGELAELVWARFEREIRRHASEAECMSLPGGAQRWADAVVGSTCQSSEPAQPSGSVAVIVPTSGSSAQLSRCLASLVDLRGPQCEIIIVDNRPPCPENRRIVEAMTGRPHRVRYVEEPRPGSSVARNRGVAESQADIVAFTDADAVVDKNWLRWLIEPFVSGEVGATTGLVLPLELETPAQKAFERYSGFSKGMSRRSFDLLANRPNDCLLYPFWGTMFGSGNSVAYRREALVAAGGFDPALGAGSRALAGADLEAMSAVVLRGQRLVYEPRSLCWHEHRRNDDALQRQMFNYGVGCTAILTKACLHDRRFMGAVVRSIPLALELLCRDRAQPRDRALEPPPELARLQWQGMLRGPGRYVRSVLWSRRLGLDRVIHGG
jgi:O-antigen biosynthesis protein